MCTILYRDMGCGWLRQNRDSLAKRLSDESGQSIILVSIVILSFLMFFSFAINTGLLINAKISVQSAADAAAYAGAAAQARQLNAISFLNYDMRRQYKKFIFRYSFVGSMGSYKFPAIASNPPPTDPNTYDFEKLDYSTGNKRVIGLKVPVICIPLTQKGQANDNCVVVNMKSTAHAIQLLSAGGNAIQNALIDNLKNIELLQNQICAGQGQMNLFVLLSWLFRADVGDAQLRDVLSKIQAVASAADTDAVLQNIGPLVGGLGLYPRNIISLMRIETLRGFINEPHKMDLNLEDVSAWEKDPSVAETRERSIQAFRSALSNLNTKVFDPNLLKMDELQGDQLLDLQDVLINFNAYVQQQDKNTTVANDGKTLCNSRIDPFPVVGAPVGTSIVSAPHVSYAVHLKAFILPHGLLYLPNSEPLELDAYAGAKPFGSRIGPALPKDLTISQAPSSINGQPTNDCSGTAKCDIPSLHLGANANSYSVAYLVDLKARAMQNGTAYTMPGIQSAQLHAMAPNPEEVGHFNILPPPKSPGDQTQHHMVEFEYIPYSAGDKDSNPPATGKNARVFRFYAPIFAKNKGDVSGVVTKFLDKIFAKADVSANPFGINMNDMRSMLNSQIIGYINTTLNTNHGEYGETQTFAALELPMPATLQKGAQGFWLTEANQVLSSWAPSLARLNMNDDGFGFDPRFGYSVKFVTMHDLQAQGISSDDEDVEKVSH